ncbi:MAG: radical SAM protein [Desulfobacteraceae bacterium]|nr:MAG: radical SAM protein [Desulfobacteraceae bacterium]
MTLATASSFLEKDGHALNVTDYPALGLSFDSLKNSAEENRPDFAIWNTGTPTLVYDIAIAESIKSVSPETTTCVMGTHVSVMPAQALNLSSVDIVIRGEPELTIRKICSCKDKEFTGIPGISFRDKKGGIIHNPDSDFMDAGIIPFPAWHHLDITKYRLPLKNRPFLIVAPLRGCPFPCSFCTAGIYYGKKLRKRTVNNVIEEILNNRIKYNVNDFFIWADTFTADREYVREFCSELLSRNIKTSWTCNSRVDTVDRDMLELMKKAGMWMISFGLESGSDEILRRSKKGIRTIQSKRAVETAHRLGIITSGHFIYGLPGETESSMMQTLSFALDLPLDIAQFYAASPFPGTGLYDEAISEGWLKENDSFSQSHAVMELPGLSAKRVDDFRQYSYRRFYSRISALFRLLKIAGPFAATNIPFTIKSFSGWVKGR